MNFLIVSLGSLTPGVTPVAITGVIIPVGTVMVGGVATVTVLLTVGTPAAGTFVSAVTRGMVTVVVVSTDVIMRGGASTRGVVGASGVVTGGVAVGGATESSTLALASASSMA